MDLLFPKFCFSCGKYGANLCLDCFGQIEKCQTYTCFCCGKLNSSGQICVTCRSREKLVISKIIWAASYKDDKVRELLHRFKYEGSLDLGEIAAEMLMERIRNWPDLKGVVAVPVPLHSRKLKRRGFNQAELITRAVSKKFSLPGGLALTRVRNTSTQVGLGRKGRLKNMIGAFKCADPDLIKGKKVLLIDDVVTTGSTLNECAKVLKESGAAGVIAAVVAKG